MDTFLCAGCGENEAEQDESLCSDCHRELMLRQVSWTNEDTVEKEIA